MSRTVHVLVLDLLQWLARKDRSYEETLDAWRTSCPNLQVWEDANERGLVFIDESKGRSVVRLTAAGVDLLDKFGPERAV